MDVTLVVAYGVPIPRACGAVRRNVIDRVEKLTGFVVTEVNVSVEGLYFPEHEQPEAGQTSDPPREPAEEISPEARGARSATFDAAGPGGEGATDHPYAGLLGASFSLYRQTVYNTVRFALDPYWVAARAAQQNARLSALALASRAALGAAFPASPGSPRETPTAGSPVPQDTEAGDGTTDGDGEP